MYKIVILIVINYISINVIDFYKILLYNYMSITSIRKLNYSICGIN